MEDLQDLANFIVNQSLALFKSNPAELLKHIKSFSKKDLVAPFSRALILLEKVVACKINDRKDDLSHLIKDIPNPNYCLFVTAIYLCTEQKYGKFTKATFKNELKKKYPSIDFSDIFKVCCLLIIEHTRTTSLF